MSFSNDLKASLIAYIDSKESETSLLQTLRDQLARVEAAQSKINSDITNLEGRVTTLSTNLDNRFNSVQSELDDVATENDKRISELIALGLRISALEDKSQQESQPADPVPVDPKPPAEPPVPPPPPPVPPTIPSDATIIPLYVRESASVSRSRAFVSTGVPISESLNVTDLSRLTLLDSQGFPIQTDFRPTAYWRTSKSPKGVQWIQISFFDAFVAGEEKQYNLIITPSQWLASTATGTEAVKVVNNGSTITVSSGNNVWAVDGYGIDLKTSNDKLLYDLTKPSLKFDGLDGTLTKTRRLEIEYAGPLVCFIQVETETNLKFGDQLPTRPSTGKDVATGKPIYPQGSIVVSRRYEFRAGSGTVTCQQCIKWEGTKNGTNWLDKDGVKVNGVLGELWQDTFTLSTKPDLTEIRVSDKLSVVDGGGNKPARLSQNLRANRLSVRSITYDQKTSEGTAYSGGLVLSYGEDCLCFGLAHMDRYEPQSLSYDPATSSVSVSYASNRFWLAHHQGCPVRSVIALEDESRLDETWAELNHPLRIFATDSSYYSVAGLGAVPSYVQTVGSGLSGYQLAIKSICDSTLLNIDRFGLYGLQTYMGLPRYWGKNDGGDEVGQPNTPRGNFAQNWDDAFKWGAWTDYYSSSRTAITLALLSGDSKYLDLLSTPSADRMLYTQIMTGSPDDKYTHIGWAPTGYSAFRSDMNSSHSYYENLYWSYFLLGDRQIIDILSRGEDYFVNTLKTYLLGGRHANQHIMCQRFLSHAHYDEIKAAKYGQSFESLVLKSINDCYIEGTYNGELAAFWVDGHVTNISPEGKVTTQYGKLTGPSRYATLNHYASAIWDFESLYQLSLDYPQHKERVDRILVNVAKTLQKYGPEVVAGNGSIAGDWSRSFLFTWNGLSGIDSRITNLINKPEPGEAKPVLYPLDKPGMCAWWARAAQISGDANLSKRAGELVQYAISEIIKSKLPMGKEMGLCECRLMAAVGELTDGK